MKRNTVSKAMRSGRRFVALAAHVTTATKQYVSLIYQAAGRMENCLNTAFLPAGHLHYLIIK